MHPRKNQPKGPGGTWVTGQRVPEDGWWQNQWGQIIHLAYASTFPPRVGRGNGVASGAAYWKAYEQTAATVLF